jgi:hypothetical protein
MREARAATGALATLALGTLALGFLALGFLALGFLAACDAETLQIAFQISGGPVQACPSTAAPAAPTCADVPLGCDAVLNIRIVRPSSPEETYLPLCAAIPRDRRDLCSIEQIHLPARQLPEETLEVQAMIWPRTAVKEDPVTGELDCREIYGRPVSIGFGVHGFPEEMAPAPAIGGRAYYHPGDDQTVVTLGCSDLPAVNRPVCAGRVDLVAGVNELGNWLAPVSLQAPIAVRVGEPRYAAIRDEHEWAPLATLEPQPAEQRWGTATEGLAVEDSLCVEVIGTSGANVSTVRCTRVDTNARMFELAGTWLATSRLQQILAGLMFTEVPPQGLTIGVVLDATGQPAAGYRVESSPLHPVKYLGVNYQVVAGGVTTPSGLFVSEDTPYGADFRAYQGLLGTTERTRAPATGGRVNGKVTIAVLQLGS